MDVGAELATAGGHAVQRLSGPDPVLGAGGVDEELLDRRRGGGLQAGHRGGADQDPVDRHQRVAVGLRPLARQVLRGALGGSDSTAHADRDVGLRPQFGIGGQQQVVKVFPGVVTAGTAAFHMGDHGLGSHLRGDPDNRADLLDGAGLEADVADTGLAQLVDQCDGLLKIRNAGADDDSIDRGPGLTGLLHQAFSAHLQLPQIRVEEERVELDRPARLQQGGQLSDPPVEDRLGNLTAAGEFSPVPGVGRGCDDARVDGRRGHPRQQHRRAAGEPGELRRQLHRTVGQADHRGRITRPRFRHLRRGSDGEQVALAAAGGRRHDPHAETANDRGGQPGQDVTGSEVEDPARAGIPETGHRLHPVNRLDHDSVGHRAGQVDVEADCGGPPADDVNAVGQPRRVKSDLDGDRIEHRLEH